MAFSLAETEIRLFVERIYIQVNYTKRHGDQVDLLKFTSELVWLFNCNTNTVYRRALVVTVYYTFGCQIKLRFRLHIIVQTHKYTLGKKK